MLPPNTALFISDLHLSASQPAGVALFRRFAEGPAKYASQLYILGDLFDVWVGEDINSEFQAEIADILMGLVKHGVKLYFLCGNRDFLISHHYLSTLPCQKLSDPTLLSLHGIPTLLMHGDTLCTNDITYQRYRKIAQNPIVKWIFLKLPKRVRANIGHKLRLKSQAYQSGLDKQHLEILDVAPLTVAKVMAYYGVRQLFHGHVHRPAIHELSPHNKTSKRVVLGDWYQKGSVIISTATSTALATYEETGLTIVEHYTREEIDSPLFDE